MNVSVAERNHRDSSIHDLDLCCAESLADFTHMPKDKFSHRRWFGTKDAGAAVYFERCLVPG